MIRDPGKQKKMATRMQDDCSNKKKFSLATVQRSCRTNTGEGRPESSGQEKISKALLFTEYFTCDVKRVGNETF